MINQNKRDLTDFHKCHHIEAEIKWMTFCRRHFHINFLLWKFLYFDSNVTPKSPTVEQQNNIGLDSVLERSMRQAIN